jgi:transposase
MGGGVEHQCEWREKAESLEALLSTATARLGEATDTITALNERVTKLQSTVEKLQRHVFGQRSEKMPRVSDEIRDASNAEAEREAELQKRRENAAKKRELPTRRIEHKVPEDRKVCPKCGGHDFTPLGEGKVTELYELVLARVERQLHVQEKVRCRCGETIITADVPPKVFDKTRFGPTFMAQAVVSKCADSIPLYRQAKAYRRAGVPVDDSTLGDLFHQSAHTVAPLYTRLLELVPEIGIVLADETTMRVLAKKKTRTAWIWSFIAHDQADKEIIAYVYSQSRSGETPVRVLGNSTGKLLVDGYSAYNKVTVPGGRERAGCLAHLRRKFFEAQSTAPEAARKAMDFILEVYKLERTARDNKILGTPEHLAMRQSRSRLAMEEFRAWLDGEQPRHLPNGPMGEAIKYAINQWDALTLFLSDSKLAVDNNASEAALRICALGRKNFLFVGNDEAGENLAGLYSLIATCEVNGVNPVDYLADVLIRVQTHPASRIDELLPHNWTPPRPQPSA